MRRLTFQGYLKEYVKKLSFGSTNNISKLAAEAQSNYRLREPLFLYAVSSGKADLLFKAIKDNALRGRFSELSGVYSFSDLVDALENKSGSLGELYHKVYRSYVSRRDMPKTKDNTKRLMHNRIVKLQADKNVTNYRLYTDLKLNGPNVNAFLKHKAANKMSLNNVRKMLEYLESA